MLDATVKLFWVHVLNRWTKHSTWNFSEVDLVITALMCQLRPPLLATEGFQIKEPKYQSRPQSLCSPWPAVGKRELWEQTFWNNNGNNRILPIWFHCAVCIYGACLKWLLPELLFSDCWSRRTEPLGTRLPKYMNRAQACLNASIGSAATNAEKWNVFYKGIPLLLPSFNLLLHLIEGERELVQYQSWCHFLQGMYFWYNTNLVLMFFDLLNMCLRNTLTR